MDIMVAVTTVAPGVEEAALVEEVVVLVAVVEVAVELEEDFRF